MRIWEEVRNDGNLKKNHHLGIVKLGGGMDPHHNRSKKVFKESLGKWGREGFGATKGGESKWRTVS